MRVLAVRRNPEADDLADEVFGIDGLHGMLAQCDYAAVAAPLTPGTRHLMGAAAFASMKPSAVIMNVGRGPVIDEAAMVDALASGRIRGAWLDVFEAEPLPAGSPLWSMPNVFISAHTADQTITWMEESMDFFLGQLARWRNGQPLENVVDKRRGY
jgi:phosphoglycerate dehydrogenase-like enzyme